MEPTNMPMSTQTLEPASAVARARDLRQGELPPLMRHALFDPPRSGPHDPGEVKVWRPACEAPEGGDTLLTLRYLALQTIQVRLDMLFGGRHHLANPVLNAFVAGRFDHVYVDAASFARFAALAPQVRGTPDSLPAFLDLAAGRLVVDVSRFFEPGRARITSAGRAAVIAVAESPRLARSIAQVVPTGDGAAVHPLLEASRQIARYVIAEVTPELSPLARDLAQRAGAMVVIRALLSGWRADVHAVMAAFEPRWKEFQPGDFSTSRSTT